MEMGLILMAIVLLLLLPLLFMFYQANHFLLFIPMAPYIYCVSNV